MSDIQDKVIKLQGRIYRESYYERLWDKALMRFGMSVASIDQHEHADKQLVQLVDYFWQLLPDSAEVRHGPFFDVCDIAEHIFDGEEDQ